MINNLGSKALETKIDDYMGEYVSDYVSTYMSASNDQIEANRKVLEAGFEDFIVPVYEDAPYTTIQNRAQVTRSLKAIAGLERIKCRSINILLNEFGPNGEQVWEIDSKDARIRFVGSGWTQFSSSYGSGIANGTVGRYCEITFYGTGLNMVCVHGSGLLRDARVSVDGGAIGSNILPGASGTQSTVINGRNYNSNQIIQVTSGLSLGWHTAKIQVGALATDSLAIYGFDILNDRSDIAVYPGQGISNGRANSLAALSTSSFNSGVTGTRGARIVKYIENATINTLVQEVDAAAAYLTATNHSNEEVFKRINFREFGAARADDFSTLTSTASSRAFTLDDGITTLVGANARAGSIVTEAVTLNGNVGNYLTLTFIGTGLDLVISTDATTRTGDIYIDNALIGTVSKTASSGIETRKICSGLSYGTHTVKLYQTSSVQDTFAILDFIIYQPKKPQVPATGFEIADYNVVANYAITTSPTVGTVPTGIIRKFGPREATFVGTWVAPTIDTTVFNCGFNIRTITAAGFVEYTFWGTGIEFRTAFNSTSVYSQTYSIDGSTNLSSYTTSLITATTGLSFTALTGTLSGTASGSNPGLVRITGLPLGLHKIKVLSNNVAPLYVDAFDVITPIYINDPSLKNGSQSIKSVAKFSPEKVQSNAGADLSKAKALLVYNSSSQTAISSMNISSVIRLNTGIIRVFFEKPFKNNSYTCVAVGTTYDCAVTASNTGVDNKKVNCIDLENFLSDTNAWLDTTFNIVCFGELFDE